MNRSLIVGTAALLLASGAALAQTTTSQTRTTVTQTSPTWKYTTRPAADTAPAVAHRDLVPLDTALPVAPLTTTVDPLTTTVEQRTVAPDGTVTKREETTYNRSGGVPEGRIITTTTYPPAYATTVTRTAYPPAEGTTVTKTTTTVTQ
jgi:hypothetical protein